MRVRAAAGFGAALVLLSACEALSPFLSLGTSRADAGASDARAGDAEPLPPDAAPGDAGPDASTPDAGELPADLVITFLSDPPQAIEPGGSFGVEVTIENRGGSASTETTVRFELVASGALLLAEPFISPLAPNQSESRRLELTIPTSTAGAHRLRAIVDPEGVIVESDDDNNDALAGRVFVGSLVVLPQSLDLSTPIGCVRTEQLSIENRAGRSAQVGGLTIQGTAEISASSAAPLSLAAGGSITATISYEPTDRDLDRAVLYVLHDLGGPVAIELVASGDDRPRTEIFRQFSERKVDLLFVIDDSCSMDEEQARLGARFASFLDFAETETIDYQVAVTTTDVENDAGRFVGSPKIITPATSSPGAAFAANAMVGLDGSGSEQGILAAERALSSPLIEAENAGFLRPEASLALVYVSDEDDQSPGALADYAQFLTNLRSPPFLRVNAIVGDLPNGCATAGPGTRYRGMVDLIGGATASICTSDWDQTLIALAAGGFGFKTRFELAGTPVASTLEVRVNGQLLAPELWNYEENAIQFEPAAVPEAGSEIGVSYVPGCSDL